ncbi:MAG: hypothetical protein WBW48_00305 [Anaerolineae bacterium]
MSQFLLRYFGLGLLGEPTFGKGPRRRSSWSQVLLTIVMYLGVVLGVLAEYSLTLMKSASPTAPLEVNFLSLFKAWLVATFVFPLVFPKIFGPMDVTKFLGKGERTPSIRVLQFFVAFQNGFFWQAVLM